MTITQNGGKIMSFFSVHPMGGDVPQDIKDQLLDFSEEEIRNERFLDVKECKQRLEKRLYELAGNGLDNYSYVLPFLVLEYEIQIEDKVLSEKIKNRIGDGGAKLRGYPVLQKHSEHYPKKENKWNHLESPFDYAVKLSDLWDELMQGTTPFTKVEQVGGFINLV
jgi:hypothetical protein